MPKLADMLSGVIVLVFGLSLVLYFIPTEIALPDYEVTMSPRLLPYLCGIAIIGLSLALVVGQLLQAPQKGERSLTDWFRAREAWSLTTITGLFVVCIVFFQFVAPAAAGWALIVGALLILGERNPITLVVMPVALLLGAYLLFYDVLGTAIG